MAARMFAALGIVLCVVAGAARAQPQDQVIDLALVLAVDVSTSVNEDRFQLQRQGYAAALVNPAVIEAIRATPHHQIAITFMEWASADLQRVVIPWTIVSDAEGGQLIADQLLRAPRSFRGWTAIGAAIDAAVRLLDDCPYPAMRRAIDVSGDGVSNHGRPAADARDDALARGISINGLVIFSDIPDPNAWRFQPPLDEFYRDQVIGGTGAFVLAVDGFDTFAQAILGKLIREIGSLPASVRLARIDRRGMRIAAPSGPFIATGVVGADERAW